MSAACTTGPTELATVTGVVVSTTVQQGVGVLMTVRADDGTDHTIRFAGRDPNNTLPNGSENPVEDAWFAPLPTVGERYQMKGALSGGGEPVIDIDMCAEGAQVSVLSPVIVSPEHTATMSASAIVAVAAGVLLGGGALVLLLRRRRA